MLMQESGDVGAADLVKYVSRGSGAGRGGLMQVSRRKGASSLGLVCSYRREEALSGSQGCAAEGRRRCVGSGGGRLLLMYLCCRRRIASRTSRGFAIGAAKGRRCFQGPEAMKQRRRRCSVFVLQKEDGVAKILWLTCCRKYAMARSHGAPAGGGWSRSHMELLPKVTRPYGVPAGEGDELESHSRRRFQVQESALDVFYQSTSLTDSRQLTRHFYGLPEPIKVLYCKY